MLNSPAYQARLNTVIEQLVEAYAAGKPLADQYNQLRQNATALKASADAAEADAKRLREEVREMLGQLIGRPNKEIRTKNAEHRAAIELAEDYRDLSQDLEDDIARAHIAATCPASEVSKLRTKLFNTYTDLVLEEAISEVAPRLKYAIGALSRSMHFLTDDEYKVLVVSGLNEPQMVYRHVSNVLKRMMENVTPDPVPAELENILAKYPPFGVPYMTPASVHVARIKLEARQAKSDASSLA